LLRNLSEFFGSLPGESSTDRLSERLRQQIEKMLEDFSPKLVQQIINSSTQPGATEMVLVSSMKCLEAWMAWGLRAEFVVRILLDG
jgi:hypothetical protein